MLEREVLSSRLQKYLQAIAKERKSGSPLIAWCSFVGQMMKLSMLGLKGKLSRQESYVASEDSVDVLFVHEIDLMKRLNRKRGIFSRLSDQGFIVKEINSMSAKAIANSGWLVGRSSEDLAFRNFDLYSRYLVEHYKPKVIVTDNNGDLLSPFLKQYARTINAQVVHLPHSVLTSESSKYGMIDYDYYLLYGKSSLEHLQQLKTAFGQCHTLCAGSYLFDSEFSLPNPEPSMKILLLGMGPAMEEDPVYAQYYQEIVSWLKNSPAQQLDVRLHPRSQGNFWRRIAKVMSNVNIRPQGEAFMDSCRDAYMCITPYTNAVVDAALLGRPSLLICGDDVEDYLQIERFFHGRVSKASEISSGVEMYRKNYKEYQRRAYKFSHYHVEKGSESVAYISEVIGMLVKGEIPVEGSLLKGSF